MLLGSPNSTLPRAHHPDVGRDRLGLRPHKFVELLYILHSIWASPMPGFVPGILLHLTCWYPERFPATATVSVSTAISMIVGTPLSAVLAL